MKRTMLLLALLLPAGCATQRVPADRGAAVAPALSVERFLKAANARDLYAMGQLFGTEGGPIGDTGSAVGCGFRRVGSWFGLGDRCLSYNDVELRMNAIAQILDHEDYQLGNDEVVPGRNRPTTRVSVRLRKNGEDVENVPFVVVQASPGTWLIEEIGLERITSND